MHDDTVLFFFHDGLYQLDLANSLRSRGANVGPLEKVEVILVKAKEDPRVEQCASHTLKAASHHRGRGQSAYNHVFHFENTPVCSQRDELEPAERLTCNNSKDDESNDKRQQ